MVGLISADLTTPARKQVIVWLDVDSGDGALDMLAETGAQLRQE